MKLLYFIFTHDLIQKAVKLETSLLAERRKKEVGNGLTEEMLEELVMDERTAYEILFKRLFSEAHAEVMLRIPAHCVVDTPTDLSPLYNDFPDFRQDRDFVLFLNMSDDFPMNYTKSMDIKLQQFLIDYLCYRWLETKSPNDSQSYFSRLEKTQKDILTFINRKRTPMKRWPSFP
jgi:hypothetical protein